MQVLTATWGWKGWRSCWKRWGWFSEVRHALRSSCRLSTIKVASGGGRHPAARLRGLRRRDAEHWFLTHLLREKLDRLVELRAAEEALKVVSTVLHERQHVVNDALGCYAREHCIVALCAEKVCAVSKPRLRQPFLSLIAVDGSVVKALIVDRLPKSELIVLSREVGMELGRGDVMCCAFGQLLVCECTPPSRGLSLVTYISRLLLAGPRGKSRCRALGVLSSNVGFGWERRSLD